MRAEFEREVEAARREFEQEVEAVRGTRQERRRALDKQGHLAFLKKADMRRAHALLHQLEQHLLKQNVQL
jgi:hypothetical protein